jgi:GH25 family lysozyme M1 (1,4-beta-N-acetylmuramidase)
VSIPDISNNNPGAASENWAAVKAAGVDVAACKASEGNSFIDWTFGPNWTQMALANIDARIPYHFAHPSESVSSNAQTYIKAVNWGASTGQGLRGQDRRAVDMEVYEGQSPQQVVNWALAWEQQTRSLGGQRPLFYTYYSYLGWLGTAAQALTDVFDLWVAAYQPQPPAHVTPWPSWALWQFTDSGSENGINGQCDLSAVSGSFWKAKPQPPTPAVIHLNAPIVGGAILPGATGYRLCGSDGGVIDFQAGYYGSTGGDKLAAPVVGIASSPDGKGYWLVAADGGVFTFGDAKFFGSLGGQKLDKPVVGMLATATGNGYRLVTADGQVFRFGDALAEGAVTEPLAKPVVGIASAGVGYWLVAADGGVFSFKAPFVGSEGEKPLAKPVVGMAGTPSNQGYWLFAEDGGVFAFGDAPFCGSMGEKPLAAPIVGGAATPTGKGYFMWGADGGVFTFGDAPFHGAI